MEFVALPLAMLDSPEYRSLKSQIQVFLIELYAKHGDCERFAIESDACGEYGYADNSSICRALRALLDAGLIMIDGGIKSKRGPPRKIFTFKYPIIEIFE